jgi:hypothetical protein
MQTTTNRSQGFHRDENASEAEAQAEANMATPREQHLLMGRLFTVAASFPDNVAGTRAANAHMTRHEGLGVLDVADGRIILADCADKGTMALYQWYRLSWQDGITRDVWAASVGRARALGDDLMERELFDHGAIVACIPTGA